MSADAIDAAAPGLGDTLTTSECAPPASGTVEEVPPASSDTISPTDVNDLTRPDENTKTTTSRMIDLVPDGDLVIVLSNLERPSQHGFIRKLLNDLRPTGADELAETDSLPDEVHVRVHENMLKHIGK